MTELHALMSDQAVDIAADSPAAGKLARQFGALTGGNVYRESIVARYGVAFFMLRKGLEKRLALVWSAAASPTIQTDFEGEQVTGHIDGAVHKHIQELVRDGIDLDKGLHVTTVCRSGYRSNIAGSFLKSAGYAQVFSLIGGMTAWGSAQRACQG